MNEEFQKVTRELSDITTSAEFAMLSRRFGPIPKDRAVDIDAQKTALKKVAVEKIAVALGVGPGDSDLDYTAYPLQKGNIRAALADIYDLAGQDLAMALLGQMLTPKRPDPAAPEAAPEPKRPDA